MFFNNANYDIYGGTDAGKKLMYDIDNAKHSVNSKAKGIEVYIHNSVHAKNENGTCPSVLLELGFLSNMDEADYLTKKENKNAVALAILMSIKIKK